MMRISYKLTKRATKTEMFSKNLKTNMNYSLYTDCIEERHSFNPQLEAYGTSRRFSTT